MALTIHDRNRAGNMEIMDTNWANETGGILHVTVRDMTYSGKDNTAAMRRLARKAVDHHAKTAKVVRRWNAYYDKDVKYVTFAIAPPQTSTDS